MSNKFSASQMAIINRDNRLMAAAAIAMADILNDLYALIDTGNIGITANAFDVDSLALGGGAFSIDFATSPASGSLNFSLFAGRVLKGQTVLTVGAITLALTTVATNYIEVDGTGTVSKNTTGFTVGKCPLYVVITGVSSWTLANVTNAKVLLEVPANAAVVGAMLSAAGATKELGAQLGTISATTSFLITAPAYAAVLAAAALVNSTAFATSGTDYWTFSLTNRGAAGAGTTVMLDATVNTTNSSGGSTLVAKGARSLTLSGTPANLVTAANDTLEFTATKTGTPANLTLAALRLDFLNAI